MFGAIGLVLLLVPIVELAVILAVGDWIGFGNTLAALILISIAGAVLLKREGVATWRRLQTAIQGGRVPTEEATDGALILFGGALLLTPGFVTDALGLLFLVPVTRSAAKRVARKIFGVLAMRRLGVAGAAAGAGKRIYSARATHVRRATPPTSSPESLPSAPRSPSDEAGSPDTG